MSVAAVGPNHSVLLIGVGLNIRREGNSFKDKSVKGAVQDILDVKEYFSSPSELVDITILTASKSSANEISVHTVEPVERQATYKNTVFHLKRIIDIGKHQAGHRVYIHFSGHGTRNPHDKNSLSLVLYDPNQLGARYLPGNSFRNALKQMVENGMLVTVVLDCCYSGHVLRTHSANIRCIEYDSTIAIQTELCDPFASELADQMRATSASPKGLLDPDGYTIFAACGPDEEAWEIEVGGLRKGALSHFLCESLAILKRRTVQASYEVLHQYILAKFRSYHAHQTPMLYGNRDASLFDGLVIDSGGSLTSVYRSEENGRLTLDAGRVHGVHVDDEYDAYPLHSLTDTTDNTDQVGIRMKVTTVGNLTSEVRLIGVISPKQQENQQDPVEGIWNAKLVTSFSPQKVRVKIMPCVPRREELMDLVQQHPSCRYLQLSIADQETELLQFQVSCKGGSVYEVQHMSTRSLTNIPTIQGGVNSDNSFPAPDALLSRLGHLATFKYMEGISNKNPDPAFTDSFAIICDCDKGEDGFYEAEHGKSMGLTFENLGQQTIYVTAFRLGSFWEIENLTLTITGERFIAVPPKCDNDEGKEQGKEEWELDMQVSILDASYADEEVIKVFVTTKATTFPPFILPRIGEDAIRDGPIGLERAIQDLVGGRSGVRDNRKEEWSSSNLYVRTSVRNPHTI